MDANGGKDTTQPALASSEKTATTTGLRKKAKSYSLFLALSLIWGLAFVAIKSADYQLSPINLTLLRWLIASAGYLALLPFIGKPKASFQRVDLPRLLGISFANVAAYHLSLNYAETTVSAGLAGLLVSFGPVFIVVLSALTLKEKIPSKLILALVVAVLGALVLSIGQLSGGSNSLFGPLEVVITALAYAVFSVFGKPLVQKYGALHVAIWAGVLGTIMILPLLWSSGFVGQVSSLSTEGWASVLYLSLLSTVLGYSMFYTLLSRGAVSRLSIQLYLIPIVSVIGGVLLLGESVTVFTLIGGAAMLIAIAFAMRAKI